MKIFSFAKFTGAGNDFILFDKQLNPFLDLDNELIRFLCDRRFGIGADGILVFDDHEGLNFEVAHFNSDGTSGGFCGNGARCSIEYARLTNRLKEYSAEFLFNGHKYSGNVVNPGLIEVNFSSPKLLRFDFKLKLSGKEITYSFADTGSPHTVISIDSILESNNSVYTDLNKLPVKELGEEIRYSREFAPNGTNVNFVKIENNKVYMRTYERGIENETLACGTGAVACAVISHFKHNMNSPVEVITSMNEKFLIKFELIEERIKNLTLTGPANLVFYGKITI